MKEKKKPRAIEILAGVCCVIGCSLFIAPKLVETELDLFTIGMAFNGVGLFAFLFSRKS